MTKNTEVAKVMQIKIENFKYLEAYNSRQIINAIDQKLISKDYYSKDLDERKILIDESIKEFFGFAEDDFSDLSAYDVVELVYKNCQNKTWKSHLCIDLIHFIIGLAGIMQGKSIIWYGDQNGDDSLSVERDETGNWDYVKGPIKGKELELFKETYKFFLDEFGYTKDKKKLNMTFIY